MKLSLSEVLEAIRAQFPVEIRPDPDLPRDDLLRIYNQQVDDSVKFGLSLPPYIDAIVG